jgi:hypothetical protein
MKQTGQFFTRGQKTHISASIFLPRFSAPHLTAANEVSWIKAEKWRQKNLDPGQTGSEAPPHW